MLRRKYRKLITGIKSIRTHMAACVLKNKEFVRIENPEMYIKDSIGKSKYKSLFYIKRIKLEAYGYLVEAVRLLEEE